MVDCFAVVVCICGGFGFCLLGGFRVVVAVCGDLLFWWGLLIGGVCLLRYGLC